MEADVLMRITKHMANKKKIKKVKKPVEPDADDMASKVAAVHATRSMKVMNQALGGRYGK